MKKPYFGVMLIQRMSSDGATHSHVPFYGMYTNGVEARQAMEARYRQENPNDEFQVMKFVSHLLDEDFCLSAAGYYLEQKGKL